MGGPVFSWCHLPLLLAWPLIKPFVWLYYKIKVKLFGARIVDDL